MNPHSLHRLEFDRVLGMIAARAVTPMGREAVLSLAPRSDLQPLRGELEQVSALAERLAPRLPWAPPSFDDLRAPLRTLGLLGRLLTAAELLGILRLLESSREVRQLLDGPPGPLDEILAPLPDLPAIEEQLRSILDPEGGVLDGATPQLLHLRSALRTARARIVRRLEELLSRLPERHRVEGASISIREGRFVLPVRREGRSELGGIVHGESATGATLFVEPPLALELMAQLQEMEEEERKEVERILRAETERVRPHRALLEGGFDAMVRLDSLYARAITALRWKASPVELLEEGDEALRIVDGRHPLLLEQGVEVVPFSLELGGEERIIVVSGPNTGGKTVFLKALGLIHLLAQSGVLPPVGSGTRLPLLRELFVDIGDGQSIEEALSTFASHLTRAREYLAGAGPGTLVLIDELGTGTDPAEGAALARAILERLVELGGRGVVTSHLGALKRLDASGTGIVNASLLFDTEALAPTYQLRKGLPGRSFGLAIARRLGLPEEILDRAECYLDPTELRIAGLLESLEEKEARLQRELEEAARLFELGQAREEAQAERALLLEEQERTMEVRGREEARQYLLAAREELEAAIREVREVTGEERRAVEATARRRLEEAVARQRPVPRPPRPRRERGGHPLVEGEQVRVLGSGAAGVVREISADRVTVEVGGLRMRVPHSGVAPEGGAGGGRVAPSPGGGRQGSGRSPGWSVPEIEARIETDLRGLRVDEVERELGRAVDGAVVGGLSELRIIHGKGTGAVRARVRELLQGDPRVAELRIGGEGEGGTGVTVVVFR